ncbi:hypothetical protein MIMGU_mgv1a022871mg [Erythranthe guttata]|uniref:Uncharacterized protein n=1 Tax=Erythranthe guttata TaxID=4155 RepID=A0A022QY23_ERYGU|nr:hypothetical protein MIMGU_mgv1a022871mg [Erythranthe guttata]
MSIITKSINIACGVLPRLNITNKPSYMSGTRIFFYSSSSSHFVSANNRNQHVFRRAKQYGASRRNWAVGFAMTVVIPFFTHKWTSLLKLKNEVETAVEAVEGIVDAVEKVAEGVEKVAEDIAEDLPEGGRLRKAVDFIEHVAERANRDAHLVGDFIDKVQEVEDKVEDYVESLAEDAIFGHQHSSKQKQEEEEEKVQEIPRE